MRASQLSCAIARLRSGRGDFECGWNGDLRLSPRGSPCGFGSAYISPVYRISVMITAPRASISP